MDLLLTQNLDSLVFVQIHYQDEYHSDWAEGRGGYFGVTGTPVAWFDGVTVRTGSSFDTAVDYQAYNAILQSRLPVSTDVTIEMSGEPIDPSTYEVNAHVCVEPTGVGKDMRVFVLQVLDNWPASPSYSRNGFKEKSGVDNITLAPGECFDAQRAFTLDADSLAQWDDIRFVAWAEDPLPSPPAEVFQAEFFAPPPPPEPIPTLSHWGLVVMTLLMACAGTCAHLRTRVEADVPA